MNCCKNNTEVTAKANEQKGASMVEYALLVALIALIAIAAVRGLGTQISTQFSSIASQISPVASN